VPIALGLALLVATSPAWREIARVDDAALDELSGIVASRQHPGVLWAHNDSKNAPELFALRADGRVLARFAVAADNVDWEDIAVDDEGGLWLCDCGNNDNRRRDLRLLRLSEPDPAAPRGAPLRADVFPFAYAEQRAFPPPKRARNFDAEALFFVDGRPHLLTKHRGDDRTVLYRFDELVPGRVTQPKRVRVLDLGTPPIPQLHMVTAADATTDGRRVAVLTYGAVFVFERPSSGALFDAPPQRVALDPNFTGQVEALAFEGGRLLFTNEPGTLFRLEVAAGESPARDSPRIRAPDKPAAPSR
jgi:hypothetical protein